MGKVTLSDVRELDIDDLLGREPVKPNGLLLNRNIQGKTVLVTGAGGSIGSELCRQILKTSPKRLLLVEMSEFALYQTHQEIHNGLENAANDLSKDIEVVPLLASVCDEVRMNEIMDTWKPNTVYHAAAYKHVPLVEHNPSEGVRNNVWGTRVCAEAAVRNGVQNFVLISTDKAVNPTNIMGASKRLAEMVLQAITDLQAKTIFTMVRFGNVLASSGSVIPIFREQIKNGGPVTVTDFRMTRYFMTISEAAQLVIHAGAMAKGGEVFLLDMGKPVRILDLAKKMIELSGLEIRDQNNPDGEIEIIEIGLRPGEKLYEELLISGQPSSTSHSRIFKADEEYLPWNRMHDQLLMLNTILNANDRDALVLFLSKIVPGYSAKEIDESLR
jgi:FlaA1/EpsC-like NDP-sugar epimerase